MVQRMTHVPVSPVRARDGLTMSWYVPKSDSMARGLEFTVSTGKVSTPKAWSRNDNADISFPSSHVNSTFPGFKSRCNIDFACLIVVRFSALFLGTPCWLTHQEPQPTHDIVKDILDFRRTQQMHRTSTLGFVLVETKGSGLFWSGLRGSEGADA